MNHTVRKLAAISAIYIGLTGLQTASAQSDSLRARNVYGDVCPSPELVKKHIVLDQFAPNTEYDGLAMLPPVINGKRLIPVEPKSSDEVQDKFTANVGRDVVGETFVYAVIPAISRVLSCHYQAEGITQTILIRTKGRPCSPIGGAWETLASGEGFKCDTGRRSCMFRCAPVQ